MPKTCWSCGKEATEFPPVYFMVWNGTFRDEKQQRGYCKDCFEQYKKDMYEKKRQYARLKKELMMERAVRSLEHQKLDIYDYEEAIKAVQDFITEKPEKVDSAPEIIAAVILIQNRIDITLQQKIGKYTVDFYIPSMKTVLEIDGERHRGKLYYDNERDIELRKMLGADWEIVRIKADYLNENAPALVDAIKAVKAEKQKLRQQNNGLLPDWYSKREFAKKPRKQDYGDELLLD